MSNQNRSKYAGWEKKYACIPVPVAVAVFVEQLNPFPPSGSAKLGSTYKKIDNYNWKQEKGQDIEH